MSDSDKRLQEAVEKELEWEPRVNAASIGVAAKDGAVTLTGDVPTYGEKIAALDAAERVYGVRAVANEIEVRMTDDFTRNDAEVAEAASRALDWDHFVPQTVEAEVHDGHLTLKGVVEWPYQRREAEEAVRHLFGVKSVLNTIAVEPQAGPSDVEQRISEAFSRHARLDARQIIVTVTGGTAHLYGSVHSMAEKRSAVEAAGSAPGVIVVDDQLSVVP